ncbi:MAG: FIST C-terminal domain-containing protein [Rhodobacteraceae bacterium]|nr:FIST C-terminal domain-containing protein [Paracoccaceae bacterium]
MQDLSSVPARALRIGVSRAADPAVALAEIGQQLRDASPSFILLLAPGAMDPDALAAALPGALPDVAIFGSTTAGQITQQGYETDALMALAFSSDHFRVASKCFPLLAPVSMADIVDATRRLSAQFQTAPGHNRLALIFTDGLSKQEDMLVAALETALGDVPVFGGSAGDGLRFRRTSVLHAGQFHRNAALLLLIETDLDFCGLGFDHFQPTDKYAVVTHAIPEERLVLELNGSPAAQEYARLVGVPVNDLSPIIFAENPMLVRNQSNYHVRGIQQSQFGDGLTLLSAIDDGLVLRLGKGKEILRTLETGLSVADEQSGTPDFILGFDCYLRKLEIAHKGLADAASDCLRRHRVVGFNTYGEQHLGVHVNQTFVGIAFFRPTGKHSL